MFCACMCENGKQNYAQKIVDLKLPLPPPLYLSRYIHNHEHKCSDLRGFEFHVTAFDFVEF